ncbi:MAG: Ribosomal RNA small subunit methyltransferase G, partial [Alphaproteobacteria bacterium MarineAlpha6_Bin1]
MFCKTEQHFRKITNVSYETITKLNKYLILLKNSQLKFNLVSNRSLEDIWNRHFLDSFQIIKFIGNNKRMLDFGSGAGFPGMVCGICSTNYVYLVDSNKKKVSFLKQIKKKLNLKNVFVYHTRIENFRTKKKFDVICSRAVSSLANLLSYTIDFSNLNTRFIFLKGKKVDKEIIFSKKKWSYNLKCETSITNK